MSHNDLTQTAELVSTLRLGYPAGLLLGTTPMALLFLYFIVFIVLSGIVAAVDAAVLSVSQPEIEELIQNRSWGSRRLSRVKHQMGRSVVVIVIVTNTINVLGPILVSQKAFDRFGPQVLGIVTATLALGTIIFSEIIPKAFGAHYAPLLSRLAAPSILMLGYLMYPLVVALAWLSKLFTKGTRRIGTEKQIRSLVTIGRRAGYIESDEGSLIHRAFILNDKTAADIMTPLKDVVGIQSTATIRQAADNVFRSPYSRYPVFGASIHDVLGIALIRDILAALAEKRDEEAITSIAGPGLVVAAAQRSDELLVLFRDRHIHLAVVQEKGKTIGLVTLEDVLEELVGEIEDETDTTLNKS